MLLMKGGAYMVTGSAAVLSDALESVIHVAATAVALFSVLLAGRPADDSHPYGHGKVEYFSAGFEGALIMVAAVAIVWQAAPSLLLGPDLRALDVGTVIVGLAALVNLVLGVYLVRVGRQTRSLALLADGKHVLTDSITSFGVLIALLLVLATGWKRLDPAVAIAVAANILWTGGRLVAQSVQGLMDSADPRLLQEVLDIVVQQRRPGWIDLHRLRAVRRGDRLTLDFHLTVPRFWDIERGHAEQQELADLIEASLGGTADSVIHVDPCVPACCEFCDYEPCPVRHAAFAARRPWPVDHVVAPADYLEGAID